MLISMSSLTKKLIIIFLIIFGFSYCHSTKEIRDTLDERDYVEILFGGDVMLDWGVKELVEKNG